MNAYNIKTGEPVPRQRNPVRPETWLMPGECTDVEPPIFDSTTHKCFFNGNDWVLSEIPKPEPKPEPEPKVKTYAEKRLEEYGSVLEQIEYITEKGIEAWQTKVSSIKEKYPKPSD